MAARSACPAPSRSPSTRSCRGAWDRACGSIATWSGTPRSASGRASSRFASTARRKLPCITCAAAALILAIARIKCVENPRKHYVTDRKYRHLAGANRCLAGTMREGLLRLAVGAGRQRRPGCERPARDIGGDDRAFEVAQQHVVTVIIPGEPSPALRLGRQRID